MGNPKILSNILRCTRELPPTENYPAPDVNCAEIEKPGFEKAWLGAK